MLTQYISWHFISASLCCLDGHIEICVSSHLIWKLTHKAELIGMKCGYHVYAFQFLLWLSLQSSFVITRSGIKYNFDYGTAVTNVDHIRHLNKKIYILISRPHGLAMGCLLWACEKITLALHCPFEAVITLRTLCGLDTIEWNPKSTWYD